MVKKYSIQSDESAIFRETVRGIKPLKHTKITPSPQKTVPVATQSPLPPVPDFFSDYDKLPPVGHEERLYFARPGLQHKILRNFRKGQYNVEATLDLHGMTANEARKTLSAFLADCEQKNIRHGLIIHGKGRGNQPPVLKNKLNLWLRQTQQVLAFSSANARDGESGALYLLLKIK